MAASLALLPSPTARAQSGGPQTPLTFTLDLTHQRLDLQQDGQPVVTDQQTVGVSFYQAMTPVAELGFLVGYSYFSQADEPLLAGARLSGYHAGLALRATRVPGHLLQPLLEGRYVYHEGQDIMGDQTLALTLHQWDITAGAAMMMLPNVYVAAAYRYGDIQGEARSRGSLRATEEISSKGRDGAWLALEWVVDRGGTVALGVDRSAGQGTELRFSRRF